MNYNCPICNKLLKLVNDNLFGCENKHTIMFMGSWACLNLAVTDTIEYLFYIEQACARIQFKVKDLAFPTREFKFKEFNLQIPIFKTSKITTLNFYPDFSDMPKLLRKINMLRIFS